MKKLILCGKNSVIEALENRFPIDSIHVANQNIAHTLKNYKVAIKIEQPEFFEEFSKDNHQGYVAFLKDFPIYDLDTIRRDKPENILMLDHIQDPHNLGAIIRSANAFGIQHIIMPKKRAIDITSTVLKVSSGGFVNSKIIKVNSLSSTITQLKKMGYWIYASALDENTSKFDEIEYNKPSVMVIGNEANGVSSSVLNMTDATIYIPQKGTVQSLNASVAAALLMYKLTKE